MAECASATDGKDSGEDSGDEEEEGLDEDKDEKEDKEEDEEDTDALDSPVSAFIRCRTVADTSGRRRNARPRQMMTMSSFLARPRTKIWVHRKRQTPNLQRS